MFSTMSKYIKIYTCREKEYSIVYLGWPLSNTALFYSISTTGTVPTGKGSTYIYFTAEKYKTTDCLYESVSVRTDICEHENHVN